MAKYTKINDLNEKANKVGKCEDAVSIVKA